MACFSALQRVIFLFDGMGNLKLFVVAYHAFLTGIALRGRLLLLNGAHRGLSFGERYREIDMNSFEPIGQCTHVFCAVCICYCRTPILGSIYGEDWKEEVFNS